MTSHEQVVNLWRYINLGWVDEHPGQNLSPSERAYAVARGHRQI
ncbi:hypothetical protein ACGF5C_04875 [Micromonospora sp. NPDC047620]